MSLETPLRFSGAPGSPYTRKMLALLRYRRIPYQLMLQRPEARSDLPQPKVRLLPTFYLPGESGELEAVVDSTPLIRRFEAELEGRSVVPSDPVAGDSPSLQRVASGISSHSPTNCLTSTVTPK